VGRPLDEAVLLELAEKTARRTLVHAQEARKLGDGQLCPLPGERVQDRDSVTENAACGCVLRNLVASGLTTKIGFPAVPVKSRVPALQASRESV
jgi:hypothetical protein